MSRSAENSPAAICGFPGGILGEAVGAEIPGAVNTIAFGVIGMSHPGVKKVLRQAWDSPSRSRPSAFSGTWRVGSITMPPASRPLTVIRLGLPAQLRRSVGCTNAIGSLMAVLRQVCRNIKISKRCSLSQCQQKLGSLRFNQSRLPHHFQQTPGRSGTSCSSTRNGSASKASSASFSVRTAGPSKRPNPHGCKISWRFSIRPEDLRGRFENLELCPLQGH